MQSSQDSKQQSKNAVNSLPDEQSIIHRDVELTKSTQTSTNPLVQPPSKKEEETSTPRDENYDASISDDEDSDSSSNKKKDKKKHHKAKLDIVACFCQLLTNVFYVIANYLVYTYFFARWFRDGIHPIDGLPINTLGLSLFTFYEIFFLLGLLSFQAASFCDPGFITGDIKPPTKILSPDYIKYCQKCYHKNWKPIRAHHCKTCRKCVFRMDHHCNWTNNCIGIRNQKYFILFLIYSFIYSLLTLLAITASAILLFTYTPKVFLVFINFSWRHVSMTLLWVLGSFFIYLTQEFLSDQAESIRLNSTTVESYQDVLGKPDTFMNQFKCIFGDNKFTWPFPIKPRIKSNYLEMLYSEEQVEALSQESESFLEDIFDDPNDPHYNDLIKYKLK